MKAVRYDAFEGPLRLVDVSDPTPTPDGVVVRVGASGLCRSDWHGWKGHDAAARYFHAGAVALPSLPIGSARDGGSHSYDDAIARRRGIRDVDKTKRTFECVVANCFQAHRPLMPRSRGVTCPS